MKVTKESIENFTVEFESEEELRHEFEANLSAGGLFLSSTERPAEMSMIQLNLRLTEGGSFATSATVVRLFEAAFAVSIDANPHEILSSLTARPDAKEESEGRRDSTVWDRIRAMPYAEKITGHPIRRYAQQLSITPARPRRSR